MARKQSQNSVSLFPFLAVLVCTMGALILLLLLTTRRIQEQQNETLAEAESTTANATEAVLPNEEAADLTELASPFSLSIPDHDQKLSAVPAESPADMPTLELSDPFGDQFAMLDSLASTDIADTNGLDIPDFHDSNNPAEAFAVDAADGKESQPTEFELQLEIDELSAALDEETMRHQQLLEDIKAAEQRLESGFVNDTEQQMDQLSSLKRQEAVLRSQLEDQQVELSRLNQQLEKSSKTTEQAERILRARESALVSLRQIAEANDDSAAAGRDKTLLEFSNSTGTSQQPIIIDVSAEGFRFEPSDVSISAKQMEGFPKNDNPFLAGIAAAYDHSNPNAISSSPYVLLLVRPDGSMPFYAAQRTLKNANIHFGYELVTQDQDIVAGKPDLQGRAVIATAVNSAMNRQKQLYSGLMAQVEALKSSQRRQQPNRPHVLPDGRIAMPGENGHDTFGQYFAGGERPPQAARLANPFEEPVAPPTRNQPSASTNDLTNLLAANAANSGGDKKTSPLDEPTNPFRLTETMTDAVESSATEESVGADDYQIGQSSPITGGGQSVTGTATELDGFAATIAESAAPTIEPEAVIPPTPRLSPEEVRRNEEVARLRSLAGNFGLGGNFAPFENPTTSQQESVASVDTPNPPGSDFFNSQFIDSESATNESAIEATSPSSAQMPSTETASSAPQVDFGEVLSEALSDEVPDRIDLNWFQKTDADTTPAETVSNHDSQLTPDWSDSATAPADSTSRTVGAPENPFYGEGTAGQAVAGQSGEYQAGLGGATPPQESFDDNLISKFLRQVESELDTSRPDPYLLTLLDSANTRIDGKLAGRHRVGIVMTDNQLQIGSAPAINIERLTDQQILDATLNALAAEMDAKPAQAGRFALPFVDWNFDKANQSRQSNLQKLLQQMDVPTRTATLAEASDMPVLSWPAFDQQTPLKESANPINVKPPQQNDRGLSL